MRTHLLGLLFLACLSGCLRLVDRPEQDPCISDSDCGDGQRCGDSVCLPLGTCDYSFECPNAGDTCLEHVCVTPSCGNGIVQCGGYLCVDDMCSTSCESDSQCAENYLCTKQGTCLYDSGCYNDDQCRSGEKCLPAMGCVAESFCETARDCQGDNQGCEAQQCVQAQCTEDAQCGAFKCVELVCTTRCETSADCGYRNYCDETGTCQAAECFEPEDCNEGFTCSDWQCELGCSEANQESVCGGYACNYDRRCYESCYTDSNCLDSHECKLERCVPRSS